MLKTNLAMEKEQLKDKYSRFKQWQEQPYEYKLASDEVHHCNNCHHDFTGNYCPICSQKAGQGRIGWRSVHQGIMDIWGLGTRSLLYSVWQLLWRPGHIIGDYIDGKRQVSFPPVKMLFIIAVVYSMVFYWFFPDVLGMKIGDFTQVYDKDVQQVMGDFSALMKKYYSWFSLFMAVLAVIPTWIMFRYSPRHTAHTLPEGFFIQVFLANVMIVLSFFIVPLGLIDQMVVLVTSSVFFALYYIIVYKYLFGYGLWGTLWRSAFVYLTVLFLLSAGFVVVFNFDFNQITGLKLTEDQLHLIKTAYTGMFVALALIVLAVGFVINYIATRKFRSELKQNQAMLKR